jgi:hypothetical protein
MLLAGFRPLTFLYAPGLPELQLIVITSTGAGAATLTEGDAVKLIVDADEPGIDAADAVTDMVWGYLDKIVTKDGLALELAGSSSYDGTFTENPSGNTYVGATTNSGTKKISGFVRPCFGVKVSALLDAAMGTNSGSNIPGMYLDILTTDSRKVDESTVSTTEANYVLLPGKSSSDPTDPADPTTTRVIAVCNEAQIVYGAA